MRKDARALPYVGIKPTISRVTLTLADRRCPLGRDRSFLGWELRSGCHRSPRPFFGLEKQSVLMRWEQKKPEQMGGERLRGPSVEMNKCVAGQACGKVSRLTARSALKPGSSSLLVGVAVAKTAPQNESGTRGGRVCAATSSERVFLETKEPMEFVENIFCAACV